MTCRKACGAMPISTPRPWVGVSWFAGVGGVRGGGSGGGVEGEWEAFFAACRDRSAWVSPRVGARGRPGQWPHMACCAGHKTLSEAPRARRRRRWRLRCTAGRRQHVCAAAGLAGCFVTLNPNLALPHWASAMRLANPCHRNLAPGRRSTPQCHSSKRSV